MASIRTVRVLAAVAALPVAAVLFAAGTAAADDGAFAGGQSAATVVSNSGGNVVGDNFGNVTTTQQVATGPGASNQDNQANVAGSGFTAIDQDAANVHFSPLWFG
ncbi:hypothetical protein [Streptomyces sp. NPDC021020]|uniref:hypothetical protein n=1 Tax=Streptomyces sp. NPDC021020 TaxID=3365109 RepID=UPI0037951940